MTLALVPVDSAINALASGTYTVTRYGAGSYSNGGATLGSSSTFTIRASVQPATGRELQRLPEGERVRDWLAIWTPTLLRTQEGSSAPDRISIDGYTYEVAIVDDWMSEGGYCKAIAQRLDV